MGKELSTEQRDRIFRLRKIREGYGYSQEEFADILNISVSAYKKMESYERQISMDSLVKLHKKLKISADYILFGEETGSEQAWEAVLNCPDPDKLTIFLNLYHYFTADKQNIFSYDKDQMLRFDEIYQRIAAEQSAENETEN
ncbi:MAG: helix-turn-helix transcriptional regulator [Lachnospiraceae bacterium]|nr:helix-turn-helix transcriptional regulator [Lachnospiraceae bacterium]